jgi:hypothetical protein
MKTTRQHFSRIAGAALITLALISNARSQDAAYYTPASSPIFNPFPNVSDKGWLVRNLGPVGIGINLISQPPFPRLRSGR